MKLLVILLIAIFAVACGQKADDTFLKPMYFDFGLTTTKIIFPDGTSMNTVPTGGQTVTWLTLTGKPATFPPDVHNHSTLYRPLTWVPVWGEISEKPIFFSGSYTDLTDKPGTIELAAALAQLGYLPIPGQTTAAINATVVPAGEGGIVKDATLDCYKIWSNGVWKVLITNN